MGTIGGVPSKAGHRCARLGLSHWMELRIYLAAPKPCTDQFLHPQHPAVPIVRFLVQCLRRRARELALVRPGRSPAVSACAFACRCTPHHRRKRHGHHSPGPPANFRGSGRLVQGFLNGGACPIS
ncbi:hypothetical protein [Lysobacter gummosus]|uniref:hypothetical protein n=1 Tax=Lysobacter gummosus TaxID=262324 RepID=UPI0036250A0E